MADAVADAKVYTYAEVAEHNTHEDCWMVIENKVMDITKFLDEHPGGDEVMMSVAGQDGTDEFEDVGHSSSARRQLDDFVIGEISAEEKRPEKVRKTAGGDDGGSAMSVIISLLIVALAIYFAVTLKSE